jgi:NADP-dependent 3-hydroxy acid dehydrogenase YdfG
MESSAGSRDKMMTCQDAARAIWFAAQQPDSAVMSEMVLQPLAFQTV